MAKVKVHYKINDVSYETKGIFNNNKLCFVENDMKVNISICEDNVIIHRKNKEYEIELDINGEKCIINLIKENHKLNQNLKKIDLKIKNNEINLIYELNNEIYKFELTYEVI